MTTPGYAITGCAGSGTAWAAQLMTAIGSPCGHQAIYTVSGLTERPEMQGDSSFFAAAAQQLPARTLVLIRHPINVVRSLDMAAGFLTEDTPDDALTTGYITAHKPHIGDAQDRLGRILRYVATWDRLNRRDVHYLQVDRATAAKVADAYRALTGHATTLRRCRVVLRNLATDINSHNGPKSKVTLADVAAHPDGQAVLDKAKQWGYW